MSEEPTTTPVPTTTPAREITKLNRRGFLRRASVVGAALPVAGGLIASACYNDPTGGPARETPTQPGVKPGPTPVVEERWQTIDHDHQQGVVNFLRNQKQALTAGKGNQPLDPRIENGVKVWDLTVDELEEALREYGVSARELRASGWTIQELYDLSIRLAWRHDRATLQELIRVRILYGNWAILLWRLFKKYEWLIRLLNKLGLAPPIPEWVQKKPPDNRAASSIT